MLQVQKKLRQKTQQGFTIIELLIVIAIIGILATLVLTNFQGAQAKGRDTVRKNDINSIYQKLEEFYNENGGYPNENLTAALLPGIDSGALTDADNPPAGIANAFVVANTAPTLAPTTTVEYIYSAYDCTAAVSTAGAFCNHYSIGSFLERETPALYEKTSLN